MKKSIKGILLGKTSTISAAHAVYFQQRGDFYYSSVCPTASW